MHWESGKMPHQKQLIITLSLALWLLSSSVVVADDLVPPGWTRGGPFTTVQEWEFITAGSIVPDGEIPTVSPGIPMAIPGPGLIFFPDPTGPFGLGGYVGAAGIPGGGTILFDIPNVPDFHPVKHLQIQINGDWTSSPPPFVLTLEGFLAGPRP